MCYGRGISADPTRYNDTGWGAGQRKTDKVGQASFPRTTTRALQWTPWLRRGNSRAFPRLTRARASFLQRLLATWGLAPWETQDVPLWVEDGGARWPPVADLWCGAGRGPWWWGWVLAFSRTVAKQAAHMDHAVHIRFPPTAQHSLWDLIVLDEYS